MSSVTELTVRMENFRTFKNLQSIKIKPLTFLVGENSTGKSTALAAINLVLNRETFPLGAAFNKSPFELGSYSSIASKQGARLSSLFSLGFTVSTGAEDKVLMDAHFSSGNGQPVMSSMQMTNGKVKFSLSANEDTGMMVGVLTDLNTNKEYQFEDKDRLLSGAMSAGDSRAIVNLFSLNYYFVSQALKDKSEKLMSEFYELFTAVQFLKPSCLALAPVRSKPRRTYDVFDLDFQPEGDHVPYVLSSVLSEERKPTPQAKKLASLLEKFGAQSSLFDKISVKKLGKGKDSAFNILVKSKKSAAVNISDVGYGVSQSLPVVIEPTRSSAQVILIQQPEVHLHPKAQAALGDIYVDTILPGNKSLVIETHSDFLIDRVRSQVAKGRIEPEKVQILYFKKVGDVSEVHTINLDREGNTLNAPEDYRSFFIKEQIDLLGL
ncbi:hypothetical protein AZI85_01610 [Bdellovibrio bacteriovorus]|uniref:Endonuclease GajA/Old nuclease/RecF-like AAA domain-containing protein n=1 Tax=Bdellovibrio bacteriovorus TaxID=959 RepID=A0A150WVX1_BDEBC|nr:DUF3696 domain-containing protein [Bdellovibrio bacteriovorus]KYG70660.1 hypothetical protein AZI85_01610 [Bdellovibrio bacteriovorus]